MATFVGPKGTTKGLVLYLDTVNKAKSVRGQNLIDLSGWDVDSSGASPSGWSRNGTLEENRRIRIIDGPFGNETIVWDTPSNDSDHNGDGGYLSPYFEIDDMSMYRVSIWYRKPTDVIGRFYNGVYPRDSGYTNRGFYARTNGVKNTNFYFGSNRLNEMNPNGVEGEWYLSVGHIWPRYSGTGVTHQDTGLWDSTGFNRRVQYDCTFSDSYPTLTIAHRSYQYYTTDSTDAQQWYQPRIDKMDGNQPTLQELLEGVTHKWMDLSGNNNHAILHGGEAFAQFDSSNGFKHYPNNYFGADSATILSSEAQGSYWVIPSDSSLAPGDSGWSVCGLTNVSGAQSSDGNGWFVMGDSDRIIHLEQKSSNFRINGASGWDEINYNLSGFLNGTHYYSAIFSQDSGTYGVDAGVLKFYIDGDLKATDSSFIPTLSSNYEINLGRRRGQYRHYFEGDLKLYQYYNRPITEQEVINNYRAVKHRIT